MALTVYVWVKPHERIGVSKRGKLRPRESEVPCVLSVVEKLEELLIHVAGRAERPFIFIADWKHILSNRCQILGAGTRITLDWDLDRALKRKSNQNCICCCWVTFHRIKRTRGETFAPEFKYRVSLAGRGNLLSHWSFKYNRSWNRT